LEDIENEIHDDFEDSMPHKNEDESNDLESTVMKKPYILAEATIRTICHTLVENISLFVHEFDEFRQPKVIVPQQPLYRKREGIVYKRASFEGTGRLVISGGESGDYTIETETDKIGLEKIERKTMCLALNDLVLVAQDDDQLNDLPVFDDPTLSVSVTYNHTVKINTYPCDDHFEDFGYVKRRKYHLTNNRCVDKKKLISGCVWSKLHLKDEKWRTLEIRNYQVIETFD
jgi:hypothetical protein